MTGLTEQPADRLLAELPGCRIHGPVGVKITGITADSRQVRPGAVFVAIDGTQSNGADYIQDAIARGARIIVTEHTVSVPSGVTLVLVAHARLAYSALAAAWYHHPSRELFCIGITGTNGKTTVATLCRQALLHAGITTGMIGTVEYLVGRRGIPATRTTPDAVLLHSLLLEMVHAGCHSAVLEVSSHAIAQQRTAHVAFDLGVFTNLSRDHLDYHGDLDSYFEVKASLIQTLPAAATAVLNHDDPWCRRLLERPLAAGVLTYGLEQGADLTAEQLAIQGTGSTFKICSPWGQMQAHSRLRGRFNVSNYLAALACLIAHGVPFAAAVGHLAAAEGAPGRLEQIAGPEPFQVFVDYAHTDDALNKVLTALREITMRRLLLVFGCGGNRDRSKRREMGRVAGELADVTIVTADNPRKEDPDLILRDIESGLEGGHEYYIEPDRRRAIAMALALAGPGDTVLVAGKGHENFQEFAHKTIPFDDGQVIREELVAGRRDVTVSDWQHVQPVDRGRSI